MKVLPCIGYSDRALRTMIIVKSMGNKGRKCEGFSFRGGFLSRYYIDTKSMPPRLYLGNNTGINCRKGQRIKKHVCSTLFFNTLPFRAIYQEEICRNLK